MIERMDDDWNPGMTFGGRATSETRFNSDGGEGALITDLTGLKIGIYNRMLTDLVRFVKLKAPELVADAKKEYFSEAYQWGGSF